MASFIFFLSICAGIGLLRIYGDRDKRHRTYSAACSPPHIVSTDIVFRGSEANIPIADIHKILVKRCNYYTCLNPKLQQRFVWRLQSFMNSKLFIIKDDEGFREMPVLVSAAAVQLTFGLKRFRLPFYQYIRIYPEEFIAENSFKILAGRVEGNDITIAWNQLLKGNSNPIDGSNVGLHEMSHALYVQKLVIEEGYARTFYKKYNYLLQECKEAFEIEAQQKKDLYTEYANTNLQEFWAESVELFFEKPAELKSHYPDVFEAMKLLLNQNPMNSSHPTIKNNYSINKRLRLVRLILRKRLGRRRAVTENL